MSVDRVATSNQSQYFLSQIMKANKALDVTQEQVSSGKVSNNYAGIGDKTAALEVARAAAARADAYQTNTQLALTQTDLQDTQLTSLSDLASQLQTAIRTAAGNSDGTSLMDTAQTIFQQAESILNATDSNGNYLYGGQKSDTPPFTATSLAQLSSAPVSSFFVNGTVAKSVQVGDGQTQKIGVLASGIGKELMNALKSLYQADSPAGSLSGQLSDTQITALTGTVLPQATQAVTTLNTATAANGDNYSSLKDAVANQQSLSSLYGGFVSDIEDVNMAEALTNLNANQLALQAALTVTAKLSRLSLLNYLPLSSSGG
jgi:flagellar hook-associated protein 3 FlgL